MSNPTDPPVVVRNHILFRLATPVFAAIAVMAWWALWDVGVRGVGDIGAVARVFISLLMLPLGWAATTGTLTAPLLRMSFAPDLITARVWFVTRSITPASVQEIRQVKAAVHTGVRQIQIGRLVILGQGSGRFPVRAGLDQAMTHSLEALTVLDTWVRRQPDLVAGNSAARRIFVERGVIAPVEPHRA